jgi:hypothetical protein
MSENQKWHASWIIAALIAIAIPAIIVWTGLEMAPLIIIVSLFLILGIALLWISTPPKSHLIVKLVFSVVLGVIATLAIGWAIRYDRPILNPEIQEAVIPTPTGSALTLDLEVSVENSGHQTSFASPWLLALAIDGSTVKAHQLYGLPGPSIAPNEPEIYNQEFPPGRPVRGWLFFNFPTISAIGDFTCGSPALDKATIKLSYWDSKTKHEWTQIKSWKDLGPSACVPVSTAGQTSHLHDPQKTKPHGQSGGNNSNGTGGVIINGNQKTTGNGSPIINGDNNDVSTH